MKSAETMTKDDDDMAEATNEAHRKVSEMKDKFGDDGVELSEEEWKDITDRFIEDMKKKLDRMDKIAKLFPEVMKRLIEDLTGE